MAKNFNGSKKYIGIYGLLIAIFLALLKMLGSVHAGGVETGVLKMQSATNTLRATENKLFIEQETSRLEAVKLDSEIFRQYAEHQGEIVGEIKENFKQQRIEQRIDMAQIKKLIRSKP